MKNNRTPATWEALGAACKRVRTVTDDTIHVYLERSEAEARSDLEGSLHDGTVRALQGIGGPWWGEIRGGSTLSGTRTGSSAEEHEKYPTTMGEVLRHPAQYKLLAVNPAIIEEGEATIRSTIHQRFSTTQVSTNAGGDQSGSPGNARLKGAGTRLPHSRAIQDRRPRRTHRSRMFPCHPQDVERRGGPAGMGKRNHPSAL